MKGGKIRKLLAVVFLIIVFSLAGCTNKTSEKTGKNNQDENSKKYAMLEEPKIVEEGDEYFKMKYIVGTLQNKSSKKTDLIMLTFNLYDKDGNVVGSAFDTINSIDVDKPWKFKAAILEDNFETFKLESIKGF